MGLCGWIQRLCSLSLEVLIQGASHCNFDSKFPHWLDLRIANQFKLQPPTNPPFPLTAFDFIMFSRLDSRCPHAHI
ncbi:hypothetical protein LINPERHAP2_LOCUS30841 [Linum perenne]